MEADKPFGILVERGGGTVIAKIADIAKIGN
jgi:hypothetical protein